MSAVADGSTAASAPGLVPVVGAMVALAALDLIGAVFARSWSEHRSQLAMLAGLAAFGALFVVYAKSLDYAELSTVTFGWIVLLQVGVVIMDRFHGVAIPSERMAAMAAIVALQLYITVSDVRA